MEINVNNTFFTGKFLVHLPSVDSTNNYAKQYLSNNSPIDGTVILADVQYAGRGQSGNSWVAEPNLNLTFSIIYHTGFLRASEQFYLNMAVSLGVWSMVDSQLKSSSVKVKWPNDIFVNNLKIAGILIENTISGMNLKHSIIGIGLNVNQTTFPPGLSATSLFLETNQLADINFILGEVLARIEKYYLLLKERRQAQIRAEYLKHLYRFLELSRFKTDESTFTGKIIDIDNNGKLIIETDKGLKSFGFKEVSFIMEE